MKDYFQQNKIAITFSTFEQHANISAYFDKETERAPDTSSGIVSYYTATHKGCTVDYQCSVNNPAFINMWKGNGYTVITADEFMDIVYGDLSVMELIK